MVSFEIFYCIYGRTAVEYKGQGIRAATLGVLGTLPRSAYGDATTSTQGIYIPTRKHYYTSITLDIQGLLCVWVRLCSAFKRLVLVDLSTQAYRNKTLLFLGGHETWGDGL